MSFPLLNERETTELAMEQLIDSMVNNDFYTFRRLYNFLLEYRFENEIANSVLRETKVVDVAHKYIPQLTYTDLIKSNLAPIAMFLYEKTYDITSGSLNVYSYHWDFAELEIATKVPVIHIPAFSHICNAIFHNEPIDVQDSTNITTVFVYYIYMKEFDETAAKIVDNPIPRLVALKTYGLDITKSSATFSFNNLFMYSITDSVNFMDGLQMNYLMRMADKELNFLLVPAYTSNKRVKISEVDYRKILSIEQYEQALKRFASSKTKNDLDLDKAYNIIIEKTGFKRSVVKKYLSNFKDDEIKALAVAFRG